MHRIVKARLPLLCGHSIRDYCSGYSDQESLSANRYHRTNSGICFKIKNRFRNSSTIHGPQKWSNGWLSSVFPERVLCRTVISSICSVSASSMTYVCLKWVGQELGGSNTIRPHVFDSDWKTKLKLPNRLHTGAIGLIRAVSAVGLPSIIRKNKLSIISSTQSHAIYCHSPTIRSFQWFNSGQTAGSNRIIDQADIFECCLPNQSK